MAMFPCEIHLARYKGPASAAYPAVLIGGESNRRKYRCCLDCLTAKIDEAPFKAILVDPNGDGSEMANSDHTCTTHPKKPATAAFFLASYKRGQEGETYYSALCDDCTDKALEHWGLS